MAEEYPYVLNNGKIASLFEKLGAAAKPDKFSYNFLEKLGFTSTNDRGFVTLLRKLGFLSETNQPNAAYDDLRDKNRRPIILAEKMRELYSDLFSLNNNTHKLPDLELKGAISRVTGKDEQTVGRVFNTFKSLASQANLDGSAEQANGQTKINDLKPEPPITELPPMPRDRPRQISKGETSFHYNIQIVLPATTEVAVYNAIFSSLRENLDL